jgi:hypothetical protein
MPTLPSKLTLIVATCSALFAIACNGTNSSTLPSSGGAAGAGGSSNGGTVNTGGVSTGVSVQAGGTTATGGTTIGGALNTDRPLTTGGTTTAAGGTTSTGGTAATGGTKTTGGSSSAGGATTGGTTSTGGTTATGGTATGGAATGGAKAAGGTTATGGTVATAGTTSVGACGTLNSNPFDCTFAWGAPASGTNNTYLNHVSSWIGSEPNGGLNSWSATATNNTCWGCGVAKSGATTASTTVFYTYFIGAQACNQGKYCDCNTSNPPNLCTNGAQWIRDNQAQIVNAYAQYAKAVYAASPNKPVIWWLEGDFIQYTPEGAQTNPLTWAEAGNVARQITCAIKANEPNAMVAMNHSPWVNQTQAESFWSAQPLDVLDLIWVQGAGNADQFVNTSQTFETFSWLYSFTGKKIMAETSYAGAGVDDRWTTTTAANINARIASGVISVLVNSPPWTSAATFQSATSGFSALNSTCN